ncbi:MAG: hypothetical protein WAO37_04805 [Thermacetogeniaceae bacterium]
MNYLAAVGSSFLSAGMEPSEVLDLISDGKTQGKFYENVAVIEIQTGESFRAEKWPLMSWGEHVEQERSKRSKKKDVVFIPDLHRGLGAPFVVPLSGNKTAAQGRYGIPAYIIYPGSLNSLKESPNSFLINRLERTMLSHEFTEDEVNELGKLISLFASEIIEKMKSGNNQGFGLLVLCEPSEEGVYCYSETKPVPGDKRFIRIGESKIHPGKHILADLSKVLERFKVSKIEEGAEMGKGTRCSFCGSQSEDIVSIYNKSWSLIAPTWHAPFPELHKKGQKVGNIASIVGGLCSECYINTVVGANIFSEVSSALPNWLTREIFLPFASAGGREEAKRRGNVPYIRGSFIILPLVPDKDDDEFKEDMLEALANYRIKKTREGKRDKALEAIIGFESALPEELDSDQYRLHIIYYTESNADIQLRATIDDVLPSTVGRLQTIIGKALQKNVLIRKKLGLTTSQWTAERYGSLPYLLTRAYGGCYFWPTLNRVLHRGTLDWGGFIAGVAARMNGYSKNMLLGGSTVARNAFQQMKEEVYFYSLFRSFYDGYQKEILLGEGGSNLGDWQELMDRISSCNPEELSFNSPEELGFAAGYILARFGSQYYAVAGKNFLRHRVMTFGSNLTPETIWRRALSRFQEYALKLDMGLNPDFRKRAAVIECEYRRLRDDVQKNKDEFMGAFWSGYMLSLPAKKNGEEDNEIETKEE